MCLAMRPERYPSNLAQSQLSAMICPMIIQGLSPCCAKKQASEAPAGPAPMIKRSVSTTSLASMPVSFGFDGKRVGSPIAVVALEEQSTLWGLGEGDESRKALGAVQ